MIFSQEAPLMRKWFSQRSCIRLNWNLEMMIFEERGKPENPEKNLSKQSREPTTHLTHMWPRVQNRTGQHGKEASALIPLHRRQTYSFPFKSFQVRLTAANTLKTDILSLTAILSHLFFPSHIFDYFVFLKIVLTFLRVLEATRFSEWLSNWV